MSKPALSGLELCKKQLVQAVPKFKSSELEYDQEEVFAIQHLMKNDYLLKTAIDNPSSLRLAMYNVAAMGVTLNPQMGLAYLVPRRPKQGANPQVVLDISYRGIIAVAIETGSIIRANVELIYEKDHFRYFGPWKEPEIECDPLSSDRGDVRGGYCIAELPGNRLMVHPMKREDMDKARDKSEAYKQNVGPWIDWEEQMQLKTCAKRASKWWPKASPRLARVISYLNEDNGEGLSPVTIDQTPTSGALPPPPDESEVDGRTVSFVTQVMTRAVQSQSFGAAEELLQERLKDPSDLSYALNRLKWTKENHGQAEAS